MASNPHEPKRQSGSGRSRPPLVAARDLRVLAKLPPAVLAAWCLAERHWNGLAHRAAGLETAALERLAGRITAMLGPGQLAEPARTVARRQLGFIRLDQLCFLRSYRPGGWNPKLRLEGAEHLEAALARGRGAILWVAPTVFQWLVTKRALHEAGWPVHHLSNPNHGFSTSSWVGTRLVNPIRTRIENRYLAERVMLAPDGGAQAALRRLTAVLRGNGIVSITVAAAGARPITAPFLRGSIRAASGAPHLAARTGAALLPVLTFRGETGFVTRILTPLLLPETGAPDSRLVAAVNELAVRLEPHALAHPDQISWLLDCIEPVPPADAGGQASS
jgi:lauroyl/myristoyl acyltransferase